MEVIRIGALEIRFLLEKQSTHGSLDMFELTVPAGARVPLAHFHESWEETVYGLAGQMVWTVNGKEIITGPGDCIFIPRGAVHHFINRGTETAKALSVLTPGVLGAAYFHELAALIGPGGPPDPALVTEVMLRHGLVPVPG
ncbi:cupin domain-containing protein [Sediminicoccus sp. KRV36]|uniref:cupin domain-containing protein n=1 Tax=Sediminicoccus sp. KRV36 TaxID=3133721 RepID=UPI00200E3734|nr:cupin domain-containing protein [Sediminicoccus rosea]UPY34999.1 cupin domain-containing protein [Sediminicoccus rosea]